MFRMAKRPYLGVMVAAACAVNAVSTLQANEKTSTLSAVCYQAGKSSERIVQLLRIIASHPTAEAYNTLGASYGKNHQASCAIESFKSALQLDSDLWQARYNLGIALFDKGDLPGAEAQLRKAIQQNPNSASAHNGLALILEEAGQADEAAEEFKAAIRINPQFTTATLDLTQILTAQHKYSAAIYYLEQALNSNPPKDAGEQLLVALGIAYGQNKEEQKALDVLRRAVAAHPDSVDAHFNLGTAYANEGTLPAYQSAVKEFHEVLRLAPGNDAAQLSLGKALLSTQLYDEAVTVLKAYISHEPDRYEGYYNLGQVYHELGRNNDAVGVLQQAVRQASGIYDVRLDYGAALARVGRIDEAVRELRAAEKINPDGSEAHYQLALLLNKEEQTTQAQRELKLFKELKQRSDANVTAGNLNNKANQLFAEGRFQEAATIYRQVLTLAPNNAEWHYNFSLALAKLGDRKEEELELDAAVRLDPNMVTAHNELGLLYLDDGRLAEAEHEFNLALGIDPQNAEAQNNLGLVYTRQGSDKMAAASFQQAIHNDPRYTKAIVNLGLTLARHGDYYAAEQQFEKALQLEPQNPSALTALGMLLAKLDHHQQAIETFRKVVSLQPDSAEAHLNLGIAMADGYDPQGALKEFSKAVQLAPNSAQAHFDNGRVLYDLERREEARAELEIAHRLAPNYPPPMYFLAAMDSPSAHSVELLKHLVRLEPEDSAAQYLLGQNLMHAGKTPEAIEHWKIAVRTDPNNSSALYNLARLLAETHDPEAKRYMDRFQALEKGSQLNDRVHQLNNFALSAAQNHNWPLALEQLQDAIESCGQCGAAPTLHKNLGLIYARKGDTEHAIRELDLALKEDPRNADAQKALAILRRIKEERSQSN
jgi:tetratricopeptide (TPR) repeat protein